MLKFKLTHCREKLAIVRNFASIKGIDWQTLSPNDSHDWINQRDPAFDAFMPMGDKDDKQAKTVFETYSRGIATSRDAWAYNFAKPALSSNMTRMVSFYNEQLSQFKDLHKVFASVEERQKAVDAFIDLDPIKISWSRGLKKDLGRVVEHQFKADSVVPAMYRPYCKQWACFDKHFNDMVYQMPKIFPHPDLENLVIAITGMGVTKDFSAVISNALPDVQLQANGQCFPFYTYEQAESTDQASLFGSGQFVGYKRQDNISDATLAEFQKTYADKTITKLAIFHYVYGVLHSPEYKHRFEADLKKMLPRIPFAQDFWAFSKAGKELAHWHLNYETIEPYPLTEASDRLQLDPKTLYRVEKMTFAKNAKQVDKGIIHYNSHVTLSGIPLEAYDYVVNGKPALEWVMERYQFTRDKDSGITNNPNDWSDNPRYIIDLVKRIVRVSIETVRIVKALPALNEKV